jgi:hypothetical protein
MSRLPYAVGRRAQTATRPAYPEGVPITVGRALRLSAAVRLAYVHCAGLRCDGWAGVTKVVSLALLGRPPRCASVVGADAWGLAFSLSCTSFGGLVVMVPTPRVAGEAAPVRLGGPLVLVPRSRESHCSAMPSTCCAIRAHHQAFLSSPVKPAKSNAVRTHLSVAPARRLRRFRMFVRSRVLNGCALGDLRDRGRSAL